MKSVKEANVKGKRVLIRVGFDFDIDDEGNIVKGGDWRLKAGNSTIKYLSQKNAKVIILNHLDRPGGKFIDKLRLDKISKRLEKDIGKEVDKLDEVVGKEVDDHIKNMNNGDIVMLENVRFKKGERSKSKDFIEKLSSLGDIFVQDAFPVAHRDHSSVSGILNKLPSYAGLNVLEECKTLDKVKNDVEKPMVIAIGGAKAKTKIEVIDKFYDDAYRFLLGGVMANLFIKGKGLEIGKSVFSEEAFNEINSDYFSSEKFVLPEDVVVERGGDKIMSIPLDEVIPKDKIFDIGPKTISKFSKPINEAKTVIWNGSLGLTEREEFQNGTEHMAKLLKKSDAFTLVGGGDTVSFLNSQSLTSGIDHISTGGGSFLYYLADKEMPGLDF